MQETTPGPADGSVSRYNLPDSEKRFVALLKLSLLSLIPSQQLLNLQPDTN